MDEETEMLDYLGLDDKEELFRDIPEEIREDLELPDGIEEMEVMDEVREKLDENITLNDLSSFVGAGIYDHYVPASVYEIIGRSEFYTSYTPYQPEISQGMLQSLFEYQSLICELTGMEIANCSMYDYSTALAEAILMVGRIKRKGDRFLVPENIHWDKFSVIDNYLRGSDIDVTRVEYDESSGEIDIGDLRDKMDEDVMGFYVESPNVFGVLDQNVDVYQELKEDSDSMLVVGSDPIALSLLEPPSSWGADIVVGDSQPIGIPPSFGGPTVGIFASQEEHIRKMPGRMIGETVDKEGRTAYCMTLQTREQHIRRERATSNICTNQSLMALASASYLFLKGGRGFEELAKENYRKAHEVAERVDDIEGLEAPYFDGEFFNEFVIHSEEVGTKEMMETCLDSGVIPGVDIEEKYPELGSSLLTAVTERNSESDVKDLLGSLKEVVG